MILRNTFRAACSVVVGAACCAADPAECHAQSRAISPPPETGVLDPTRCRTQSLDWSADPNSAHDAPLTLTVDLANGPIVLQVQPASVRAAGGTVMVETSPGVLVEVLPPPPATYRGTILGRPGSAAAVSFVEGLAHAVIDPGDGTLWFVQPARESDPNAKNTDYVVYESSAIRDAGHVCGGALAAPGSGHAPDGDFDTRATCLHQADIALDTDFTYYQHHGSSISACIADSDSLVNGMNLIYERDINATFIVKHRIVRTSGTIYNTADIGALLNEVQNEWNTTQNWRDRDAVHLFTGQPTGGVIGLAYVDVVCNRPWAYGVSNVDFTTDYGARVGLICHEVGHNFAAGHCDGDPDCSIMCSGLGGCAGNLSAFSEGSVGPMRGAAARACLVATGPAAAQRAPGAIANSYTITANVPTRFDVLSNDSDPNCDVLSITAFDAATAGGATVSLSVGTGPGGRDELLYSPRTDAVGLDTFLYTIADTAGAPATARVYIHNQTLRDPDPSGPVVPGLEAAFYRTGGYHSLPDFTPLTPYATAVWPNVYFPSAQTNIVGSGQDRKIAAAFTGSIDLSAAGAYTFFCSSRDGSALFIDGALVVLNDFSHNVMTEIGGSVDLGAGTHAVRVEYFIGATTGGGLVVRYQGPGIAKQVIPASAWGSAGAAAQYYVLPNGLSALPDFSLRSPYLLDHVDGLNVPSGSGEFLTSGRKDEVAAVFTGFFVAPADGDYTLFVESNEGSRLILGSNVVVNNDGIHGMAEVGGAVRLKAGTHRIRLEYFENLNAHGLIFRAQGPGFDKQVVPLSMLARANPCPPDFDADGFVTGDDFDAFAAAFTAGEPVADFNADGFVNGDDFDAYVAAFEAGCP